jgi:hypothetical protein
VDGSVQPGNFLLKSRDLYRRALEAFPTACYTAINVASKSLLAGEKETAGAFPIALLKIAAQARPKQRRANRGALPAHRRNETALPPDGLNRAFAFAVCNAA